MKHEFFIGVDGGATKSIIRVENSAGDLIGQEVSGPANIRLSVNQTWDSITRGLEKILSAQGIDILNSSYQWHAGMGLAGCEIAAATEDFVNHPHPFTTLALSSDAHTACLAAHGGKDGAIVVIGTGVVGYMIQAKTITKVGGWGFPHDDGGGGAWLGFQAISHTLQWLDGRIASSELGNAIYQHFRNNQNTLVAWANQASSTEFATLAPIVIEQSQQGEPVAVMMMQQAAKEIDKVLRALKAASLDALPWRYALTGGVAEFIQPYLDLQYQSQLVTSQFTPEVGAILLVRQQLAMENAHG